MKMMPPDVISHENQLQHLSEPSIFMLDVFRTADHAGQIFIPHRLSHGEGASKWDMKEALLSRAKVKGAPSAKRRATKVSRVGRGLPYQGVPNEDIEEG